MLDENVGGKLAVWSGISNYNVMNSKFYKDGNEQLLSDCFDAVITGIKDFCITRNTRFEELLIYGAGRRMPWQPFRHALYGSRMRQTDREVKISEYEHYYCKNDQWTAKLPIYYSTQKEFVGYIIKKTEACLRQSVNYKHKLATDIKSGGQSYRELQRPAANRDELDKVIEKAVADFHRNTTRTVVNVDHRNLARIREEALGTQEQLIVPEVEPHYESVSAPDIQPEEHIGFTMSFSDGWKALKEALTDIECKALSIALNGSASIKEFADANGIMLEVLADQINEKAADYIGDSILEVDDNMVLYDEYRENVAEITAYTELGIRDLEPEGERMVGTV